MSYLILGILQHTKSVDQLLASYGARPNRYCISQLWADEDKILYGLLLNTSCLGDYTKWYGSLKKDARIDWCGFPPDLKAEHPEIYAEVFVDDRSPVIFSGDDPAALAVASPFEVTNE